VLSKPAPPNFEVTQAAIPMGIDPAPELGSNDEETVTSKVHSSESHDEHQPFESLGAGQFTALSLKAS
jgi:hypothetical protein